jgi:hypothetical protein
LSLSPPSCDPFHDFTLLLVLPLPFIVATRGVRLEYTGLPALRVSGNAAAVASVFPFAPTVFIAVDRSGFAFNEPSEIAFPAGLTEFRPASEPLQQVFDRLLAPGSMPPDFFGRSLLRPRTPQAVASSVTRLGRSRVATLVPLPTKKTLSVLLHLELKVFWGWKRRSNGERAASDDPRGKVTFPPLASTTNSVSVSPLSIPRM